MEPQTFRAGLDAWVHCPRIKAAWQERGQPDRWAWDWEWREGRHGGLPYASLVLTRTHTSSGGEHEKNNMMAKDEAAEDHAGVQDDEEEDDDAAACPGPPPCATGLTVDWELHILYNDMYRVPTLWLRAATADGAPLTAEQVVGLCASPKDAEWWTMLSQDEHPVLGQPFLVLHPCGTPDRMALLGGKGAAATPDDDKDQATAAGLAYLVKWFGLVATVLGLAFPPPFYAALGVGG